MTTRSPENTDATAPDIADASSGCGSAGDRLVGVGGVAGGESADDRDGGVGVAGDERVDGRVGGGGVAGDERVDGRSGVAGDGTGSGDPAVDFISVAVTQIAEELGGVDEQAMRMVLLLHRVTNMVVYDLESTVHRPAGWSWAAFRLLFTLWLGGPLESRRAAEMAGMSRQAVSALTNTLVTDGLLTREDSVADGRAVVLRLTESGRERLSATYAEHNARETQWASGLDAAELSTLIGLLGKLAANGQSDWVTHRF